MVQPCFQRDSLSIEATLVSYLLRDVLYFDIFIFFQPMFCGEWTQHLKSNLPPWSKNRNVILM